MNDFRDYANYCELYHHGILGMHWGIRRYQNPDGTLTAAGKKRYDKYRAKADVHSVRGSFSTNGKYRKQQYDLAEKFRKKAEKLGTWGPEWSRPGESPKVWINAYDGDINEISYDCGFCFGDHSCVAELDSKGNVIRVSLEG